jgi:hypothetical protein
VREHGQGDLGTMTPQAFAELVVECPDHSATGLDGLNRNQ